MVLLIFGHKSTAVEIYEVVKKHYQDEYDRIYFVVSDHEAKEGNEDVISDSEIEFNFNKNENVNYIISIQNPDIRARCQVLAEKNKMIPATIINPLSSISDTAVIGHGVYIAAFAVCSANSKIEEHVVLNYGCVVGHDSIVRKNSNIAPGVSIGGNVDIGQNVLIGSNSFIHQGVKIGNDCRIDALTHIFQNIENNSICSSRNLKVYKRIN